MKRFNYLVAMAVAIMLTTVIIAHGKKYAVKEQEGVQHIFIRYDPDNDDLLFSDTQDGPETHSHDHVRKVAKGDKVQWIFRGPHQNIDFGTVSPKDTNPFSGVDTQGNHLIATVRTDLAAGIYGYNISIVINGKTREFDPAIQIH